MTCNECGKNITDFDGCIRWMDKATCKECVESKVKGKTKEK